MENKIKIPKISLKSARVNANLTQKEASKKIGVDVATLINWEKDSSIVKAKYFPIIEDVYGYPTDFIFFGSNTSLTCK